jgi:aryl-alcohol dehydrogenase-like predicted oxidoreductase
MSNLPKPPATRTLGKSGIEVSSLAWGMWRFAGQDVASATELVHAAFDAGITLFDTADIYGFGEQGFGAAEELLGEVFAAWCWRPRGGLRRRSPMTRAAPI